MVDDLAAAAVLSGDLPVFEPGADVLDAGPDLTVCPVVPLLSGQQVDGPNLTGGQSGERQQVSVSVRRVFVVGG